MFFTEDTFEQAVIELFEGIASGDGIHRRDHRGLHFGEAAFHQRVEAGDEDVPQRAEALQEPVGRLFAQMAIGRHAEQMGEQLPFAG